jgi:tight adherence protein B
MSSPLTQLIGLAGSGLFAGGVCGSGALLVGQDDGPVRRFARDYRKQLQDELRFLRLRGNGSAILAAQASLITVLAAGTLLTGLWLCLAAAPIIALAPQHWLSRRRAQRVTAIDQQVGTFLVALANALRASPSIGESLAVTARLMPAPMNEELQLMLSEYELGTPLDQALGLMGSRIGSKTVRNALGTLRVARRSGGDLSQTLETSAASLREMARLEGVLRAKTAEGRSQALLIAFLPLPFVGILQWLSPDLIEPLGQTATGHMIVGSAIGLWLSAVVLARKILAVDL